MTTPSIGQTTSDLRQDVRELVESDTRSGHYPLRKYEKHRAYYALTGEKLEEPSNGEVSFRLLEHLVEDRGADFELIDPFDAGGPFAKAELQALVTALKEADGDD